MKDNYLSRKRNNNEINNNNHKNKVNEFSNENNNNNEYDIEEIINNYQLIQNNLLCPANIEKFYSKYDPQSKKQNIIFSNIEKRKLFKELDKYITFVQYFRGFLSGLEFIEIEKDGYESDYTNIFQAEIKKKDNYTNIYGFPLKQNNKKDNINIKKEKNFEE